MDKSPIDQSQLEELRQLFQSLQEEQQGERIDPSQLTEFITGNCQGPEREAIADRILASPQDLALYHDMSLVHQQASPELVTSTKPATSIWRSTTWRYALATAALVAFAWILLPFLQNQGTPARVPKAPLTRDYAMPTFNVDPPANTTLSRPPSKLAWPEDQHRSQSKIKLFDGSATLVWEVEAGPEPSIDVPEAVRAGLVDGAYFWVIEYQVRDKTIRLGPFWFRMKL